MSFVSGQWGQELHIFNQSFDTLVKLPVCQWSVNVIKGFVFEYSAEAGQAQNENVMVKTKVRFDQRNLLLTRSQNWCTNHLALTDWVLSVLSCINLLN